MLSSQIIIGTPGTVLDWSVKLKAIDLRKINVFVLDEADVMIDTQGHQDQSIRIQRYEFVMISLFVEYIHVFNLVVILSLWLSG